MSTLEDIRGGMNRLWDSLTEGWRHLVSRASGALTHFKPGKSSGGNNVPVTVKGSEWGLLAADLYEDDDKVVLRLEAPGMEKDDFDVSVSDGMLVVRGEKRYESQRDEHGYRIAECAYGVFERALPVPDNVDPGHAKATYKKGVLKIEIPKTGGKRHSVKVETD